jgi:Bacterial regulatory proteins, luxR family
VLIADADGGVTHISPGARWAIGELQGASTQAIATALYLSPHTGQDHLKAIFAKLGVNSRREMVAQLVLD